MFRKIGIVLALLLIGITCVSQTGVAFPVIYDTDIGSDIDDTWALALLLCNPDVDLKLVVTDNHGADRRAKIVAKFLEQVRRTDVEVGLGVDTKKVLVPQVKWAEDYDLSQFPGKIHEDGIQAAIDVIKEATEEVKLIVVGPCPNIPVLLQRYPEITKKVSVYAMSGSVRRGYNNSPSPDAEYNVREDVAGSQKMYSAPWKLTITPLDTCGIVSIGGEQYPALMQTDRPIVRALYENYRVWVKEGKHKIDPDVRSSILYDTVAVYLAIQDDFCTMENLHLKVDQRGYTVIDAKARTVRTATAWKDLKGYNNWLVESLKNGVSKKVRVKR